MFRFKIAWYVIATTDGPTTYQQITEEAINEEDSDAIYVWSDDDLDFVEEDEEELRKENKRHRAAAQKRIADEKKGVGQYDALVQAYTQQLCASEDEQDEDYEADDESSSDEDSEDGGIGELVEDDHHLGATGK